MAVQRTLVLIKPDAVQRGLIGEILARFERKGLKIVALRQMRTDESVARKHYAVHADKPFFPDLLRFITSSPLVALALEGESAVAVTRKLIGTTDARQAEPGSIRGDFGCSVGANLVHGSDSEENAATELELWFGDALLEWDRCDAPWLDA